MFEVWTKGGYGITCLGRYSEKDDAEMVLAYHEKLLPQKKFILIHDDCSFEVPGLCRSYIEAAKALA